MFTQWKSYELIITYSNSFELKMLWVIFQLTFLSQIFEFEPVQTHHKTETDLSKVDDHFLNIVNGYNSKAYTSNY